VILNGQRVKSSARLKIDDLVQMESIPPREISLKPEPIPLKILYEDDDCVVINKAAGMVVHPAAGRISDTLVNALLHHCPNLEGIGGERRPGIVHRLDKDTSGVMIVAKNAMAFQRLATQFKERSVSKEYLARVWGKLERETGIVNRPIGRHRSDRKRMSSVRFLAKARPAITEWVVEKCFTINEERRIRGWLTWIRLKPRTGRTHQIRVHLADLKHPLVGDKIYGRKRPSTAKINQPGVEIFPRQALHARLLGFTHPATGDQLRFESSLPADMESLITNLERL